MKVQVEGSVPKHLMEEMQKDKPSSDASYWAKSGCKHCHGRGTIGVVSVKDKDKNVFKKEQLCICAHRAWKKWQDSWLEERKKKQFPSSNGNGKKQLTEEERFDLVRPRIKRLEEMELALVSEICGINEKIDALPHHGAIKEFSQLISDEIRSRSEAIRDLNVEKADIESLKDDVRALEKALKDKRRLIVSREQKLPVFHNQIGMVDRRVASLEADRCTTEKELSRVSHGMRKRRREAQKKLERVHNRLVRIFQENNVESRISSHSPQLPNITEETVEERIDNQG